MDASREKASRAGELEVEEGTSPAAGLISLCLGEVATATICLQGVYTGATRKIEIF